MNVEIVLGALGHGFALPLDGAALISEEEIFGEKAARRAPQEARKRAFVESRLQAPASRATSSSTSSTASASTRG